MTPRSWASCYVGSVILALSLACGNGDLTSSTVDPIPPPPQVPAPSPVARVTVSTSGPHAPESYPLLLCTRSAMQCGLSWAIEIAFGALRPVAHIPSNGVRLLTIPSDTVSLGLILPSGCGLRGRMPSPTGGITLGWRGRVPPGDTANVAFFVECP